MKQAIKKWFDGEYIEYKNDPASMVFFVGGYEKRHWTSRAVHWAIDFYMREWKWTLTAVAGIIGAIFFKKF